MASRTNAVWRIVALIWAWTLGSVLFTVIVTVGFAVAALDLLWTLITGREGFSPSGSVLGYVGNTWEWYADLHVYGFTGKGSMKWVPSM